VAGIGWGISADSLVITTPIMGAFGIKVVAHCKESNPALVVGGKP